MSKHTVTKIVSRREKNYGGKVTIYTAFVDQDGQKIETTMACEVGAELEGDLVPSAKDPAKYPPTLRRAGSGGGGGNWGGGRGGGYTDSRAMLLAYAKDLSVAMIAANVVKTEDAAIEFLVRSFGSFEKLYEPGLASAQAKAEATKGTQGTQGTEARGAGAEAGPPESPAEHQKCASCGVDLTPGQVTLSQSKYGRPLCPSHQDEAKKLLAQEAQAPSAAEDASMPIGAGLTPEEIALIATAKIKKVNYQKAQPALAHVPGGALAALKDFVDHHMSGDKAWAAQVNQLRATCARSA